MDSAEQLGKTNLEDNSKTKNLVFAQRIPGLNIQTVVLNMEKSLKFTSGFRDNLYYYDGTLGDKTEGVQLLYSVSWYSPTQILSIGCTVVSDVVGKNVSESELRSVASNFLGYCATLSYTNSNPQLAKEWVIDQAPHPSKGARQYIGKINLVLERFNLPANRALFN
ncbi:hypothetical protein [Alicyclobacillus fastidiosus]|uniref:Uncharacterized protein n=1 Tax=Alicyclobacillus fastidiosus TaxID=392011 RepID=A0ABV5ALB5_9BACL|nr:hypothetical protein [Alicyclobacillus fastidiosus]WEH08415.1 hypothetical protein PYS47_17190 [Alicyclobacillus fastidiosus]